MASDGLATLGEGASVVAKLKKSGFNVISTKQKQEFDEMIGEEYTVTDYKLARETDGVTSKVDLEYSDYEFEIEFGNALEADIFKESLVNAKYVKGSGKVSDKEAYVCPGYKHYGGVWVKVDGTKARIHYDWSY